MATAANMHLVIPSLTALESHPDFRQGLIDAQEQFLSEFQPIPLSEDEMVKEVEMSIGHRAVEENKKIDGALPYFYWLGYVYGTINEGLAYAPTC